MSYLQSKKNLLKCLFCLNLIRIASSINYLRNLVVLYRIKKKKYIFQLLG